MMGDLCLTSRIVEDSSRGTDRSAEARRPDALGLLWLVPRGAAWAQSAAVPPAHCRPPAATAAPAAAPAASMPQPAPPPLPAPKPPAPAAAARPPRQPAGTDTRGLDQDIQGLKKDVVDLNRDLFVLEEELLFPANTQVAVFISMDVGDFFALDSVTLKIDQKEVANYLYTPREVEALNKGGVQRLYVGNLKAGAARARGLLQRPGSA